jgi:pSer/pThr/pTyr-binding forkhead associated (FHA) protein
MLVMRQIRYSQRTPVINDYPLVKTKRDDGVINVGRHSQNDFVLYFGSEPIIVSKFHGIITINECDDGSIEYTYVDIGSTNGTFVNGTLIEKNVPILLHEGDKLMFGSREEIKPTNAYNAFQFIVTKKEEPTIEKGVDVVNLTEKQKKILSEEWKCGICMDHLLNPHSLMCGHTACGDCLYDWFETSLRTRGKKSCPTCRGVLSPDQTPHPCIQLGNLVNTIIEPTLTDDEFMERKRRREVWGNKLELVKRKRRRGACSPNCSS